jgi:predicted oxidoreductase
MASAISFGCMRVHEMEPADLAKLIGTATDLGINIFDHADIYGGGRSEEVFADAMGMTSSVRDTIIIQSKCGIHESYYDFSKSHILTSVENSLRRLRTDYLDILLLHRPDSLMEPEEVADAFDSLQRAGKVRQFGVSNQNPMQIELLKSHVRQNLIVNQLQLSVAATGMVDSGLGVDAKTPHASDDGHVLEYCRIKGITIQAWSPLQLAGWAGTFLGAEKFPGLNAALERVAQASGVSAAAVAIAWILRHPANMQAIVGTTSAARITQIAKAADIILSRGEWYELYRSAGNELP